MAEIIDGLANGVEQRGASARLVGVVRERYNFLYGHRTDRHEVFVVEQDKGQFGEAFGFCWSARNRLKPSMAAC